jgi:hypothetical protein
MAVFMDARNQCGHDTAGWDFCGLALRAALGLLGRAARSARQSAGESDGPAAAIGSETVPRYDDVADAPDKNLKHIWEHRKASVKKSNKLIRKRRSNCRSSVPLESFPLVELQSS